MQYSVGRSWFEIWPPHGNLIAKSVLFHELHEASRTWSLEVLGEKGISVYLTLVSDIQIK